MTIQTYLKRKFIILRILASLLGFIPVIMLFPLITARVSGETEMIRGFALPMGFIIVLSVSGFLSLRKKKLNLNAKDGFFLVFAAWTLASLTGVIPFMRWGMSFSDSLFESACTFATTGGTTIQNIEALPRSLLLYRSLAHWFGGIGIVLISVALLPVLGVGGFQLIKAEVTGPEKEKITPKVTVTAKLLWLAYGALTLALFVLYILGGMNIFDALCHSLTTMASGGISVRNGGIASYNSPYFDVVTAVFMLMAGINFNLYYRLLQGKYGEIKNNTELRAYLIIFFVSCAIVTLSLVPVYGSVTNAMRYASYQCASILSTTGSSAANYEQWPGMARMIIFMLMLTGGCSGSTAGGIKVIRHVALWKQVPGELKRIIHPMGIFNVQINKRMGRKDIMYNVAGFFFMYLAVITIVTLITAASGVDMFSSLSAAVSVTGNIGSGFGLAGWQGNYSAFSPFIKWLFSFVMIAGRLEMWTVFILFLS